MYNNRSYVAPIGNAFGNSSDHNFDWKTGLGSLGQIAGGLFGMNQANPADAAMPYLNQAQSYLGAIPGQAAGYMQPYMQAGQNAIGQLQPQYGQLVNDPASKMNQFGSSFQQSPGYEWMRDQALGGASNAAAAGGMAGSPQHQQFASQIANQYANQDYYNYLQHVMGLYGTGLSGFGNFANMGQQSAGQLSNLMAQIAQAQAQNEQSKAELAYGGQGAQNQQQGFGFGDILGGALSLGSLFL